MQIHALIFDLECQPPASMQLIAWIDQHGNGKYTQHAHPNKTLLDVEAGHVIVHRRHQYVVTGVRPYRSSPCKDEARFPVLLIPEL
jgi:hypothetical protein